MSDPQSYCPFCKRTHDAPEFIEALKRIAELEDALYPIGKLGYDQTPRQLGMSVKALSRIRTLIATSFPIGYIAR